MPVSVLLLEYLHVLVIFWMDKSGHDGHDMLYYVVNMSAFGLGARVFGEI